MVCCEDENYRIKRGEVFSVSCTSVTDGDPDTFTSVPVTLVLSSPATDDPQTQIILRHLQGGTDGTLSSGDTVLTFSKDSEWTATYLTVGTWTLNFAKLLSPTTQVALGEVKMIVTDTPSGPLPITGA